MPDAAGSSATDLLRRESASLVQRLRLWTPARWAAAAPPYGTRGDVVFHLAQSLADAAAAQDDALPRRLPRLDSDLALADQLAVTADDLVRACQDDRTARAATAHLLLHRSELLGEAVPAGVASAVGADDVAELGRSVCEAPGPAEQRKIPSTPVLGIFRESVEGA